MKILDLFCGVGGASVGYKQACELNNIDCEIVGVDIAPQPNYPYNFLQMDVMSYLEKTDISKFDFIHASPPCLAHSVANAGAKKKGKEYADYLQIICDLLRGQEIPYVIENVPNKMMRNPIILQGAFFGLKVIRKRFFETNFVWLQPPPILQKGEISSGKCVTCAGNAYARRDGERHKGKLSAHKDKTMLENRKIAMGMDWVKTMKEVNNAVPPAYSKYLMEIYINNTFKGKKK